MIAVNEIDVLVFNTQLTTRMLEMLESLVLFLILSIFKRPIGMLVGGALLFVYDMIMIPINWIGSLD